MLLFNFDGDELVELVEVADICLLTSLLFKFVLVFDLDNELVRFLLVLLAPVCWIFVFIVFKGKAGPPL